MVSSLLFVAMILLGVTVLVLLITTFREHPTVDIDGWHRRMRAIRDTAQPDAPQPSTGAPLVTDTADRNIRLLSSEEQEHQQQQVEPSSEREPALEPEEQVPSPELPEVELLPAPRVSQGPAGSAATSEKRSTKQSKQATQTKSRQRSSKAQRGGDTTGHGA